ncbi:MAG: hypothetical protein K2N95_17620 [Lachnospiraceae bacterium]|nr:hypothetical protein [Lachnospiraceae bacterium]
MVIQHNMAAENSKRMQKIGSGNLAGASEKLSSGYQINRAADNAAGLSISEKLRFQIRGLDRGSANIDEGIGYCQVADGALNEMHDMIQRMNELSIQAANGTNSASDRSYINDEIQQLKSELDRICMTTKFNDEYIFRCEDKIESESWEVYRLHFEGFSDDLCIYNDSYDAVTGTAKYGGVAFGGKRYAWSSIDPDMYDAASGKFRAGQYSFDADDGTLITLICADGSEPPQVSRRILTTASREGIYINGEQIHWDDVRSASGRKIRDAVIPGETYYFNYCGVEISFTPDEEDTFDDVVSKLSGIVWNSAYRMPTEQTALIADFSSTTISVRDTALIKEYLDNNGTKIPKYILHAGDGTQGTYDGIWLEETDSSGNGTGNTAAGSQKSWASIGISNWGDLSTDIWEDKLYQYLYDYSVPGQGGAASKEEFQFQFQLINETSKDSVIDALDGVVLYCGNIANSNHPEGTFDTSTYTNVISAAMTYTGQLSLQDEYNLGRDFGVEQDTFQSEKMVLDTDASATSPIAVKYTNTIDGQPVEKTYGMDQAAFNNLVDSLKNTIKANVDLSSNSGLLQIIAERYAKGAANPTEITLAGVLSSANITGGGAQSYLADTVRIDTSDPDLIYTKGQSLSSTPTDYACAKIDFSGLGTSYQLADLIGLGFNSTCQTCSNHYSIQFTTQQLTPQGTTTSANWQSVQIGNDTYQVLKEQNGQNHTLYIDIDSMQGAVKNGTEFSNTLVKLIAETKFDFHYTQYATNQNDAVFYAFDYRPAYVSNGVSTATNATFDPFAYGFKSTLDVNMALRDTDRSAAGSKLAMNLKYQYNVSDLFSPDNLALTEKLDPDGKYVKINGKYVPYNAAQHGPYEPRYNVEVAGINTNNLDMDTYLTEYVKDHILKEIAEATTIALKSDRYAYGRGQAQENENKAMVVQYDTPHQLMPRQYVVGQTEKKELLMIQCSSNVIDNIEIEKQKLSVYRMGLHKFETLTEEQATRGINMIADALKLVSAIRSQFGAYQNRLEHAYAINRNTHENTQHGESVIRDTEMAGQMVEYANSSVLQQSVNSMLAQANQTNQGILTLLR